MEINPQLNKVFWDFLRYDHDIRIKKPLNFKLPENVKNNYYKNGILIDKNSSPKIDNIIRSVCDILIISRENIIFFVYASSDIQALCLNVSNDECVIQFSSGLVNLLSEKELAFVIGHELGHFIFEHGFNDKNDISFEKFQKLRSQEISVDRLGLISCGKLDYAMSAIIKTVSGLDEKFLDFNIGQFINQAHKTIPTYNDYSFMDTHPSFIIRSRSLILFSSTGILDFDSKEMNKIDMTKINVNVKNQFNKFVDAPLNKKIEEILNECALWKSAQIVLSDNRFDKDEQEKFKKYFGNAMLDKLKIFIKSFDKKNVSNEVHNKLIENRGILEKMTPSTFISQYNKMEQEITTLFKN